MRDAGGTAIGISAPGPWVDELEREGIRHIPLHASTRAANPVRDAQAARELWGILRRERIDVLHTHNPKPGVYGRIVGRAARVPIVVNTVHGLYATEDDPAAKRATVYALEAVAARCSDAELFQNEEDLALMERLHLTRRARLLGNGVDLARFDPARFSAEARRDVRRELGVDDDTVVIGTVGRLVAEKGYPELFEAIERLPRDRVRLVVAGGDDPDKPDALAPERARARPRPRRRAPRPTGRRRRAVLGDGRVRARLPPRGVPASRDGSRGHGPPGRGHRHPGLPPGRRSRRHRAARARCATRRRWRRRSAGSSTTRRCARAWATRPVPVREEHFDEQRVVDIVMGTYRDVARRKRLAIPGLAGG